MFDSTPSLDDLARQVRAGAAELAARLAGGEKADAVRLLEEVLPASDAIEAVSVLAMQRVQHSGEIEEREGMDPERFLRLVGRRCFGDARTTATVAEILRRMPGLQELFVDGVVSAGEVRRIVAAAKRRNPDELAELDEAICADVAKLEDLGADGVVEEAYRFLQRQRPDLAEAAEKRAYERRFLAFQPALDGSGSGYFELPPVEFGQVTETINNHAEQLHDSDEHDWKSWGQARADALVALVTAAGSDGQKPRAELSVVGDIDDLDQLLTSNVKLGPWGQLVTTAAGGTVQLTPKTLRQLIEHHDVRLRTVFTGGHEILGISKPTTYIPDALRTAALVRDGHAREPGSRLSAKHCDLHHVIPREQGGPTLLSNLLTTSRRAHPGLERDGPWEVKLGDDGVATYTNSHSGRTFRTLPRSMRPLRPPRGPTRRRLRSNDPPWS